MCGSRSRVTAGSYHCATQKEFNLPSATLSSSDSVSCAMSLCRASRAPANDTTASASCSTTSVGVSHERSGSPGRVLGDSTIWIAVTYALNRIGRVNGSVDQCDDVDAGPGFQRSIRTLRAAAPRHPVARMPVARRLGQYVLFVDVRRSPASSDSQRDPMPDDGASNVTPQPLRRTQLEAVADRAGRKQTAMHAGTFCVSTRI